MDDDDPFLVFKFLEIDVDEDEACYDVGLAKWTGDMDDTMRSTTKWPDKSVDVGSLVRRQVAASPNWKSFPILIKRFYSTYAQALAGCKARIRDTDYETAIEELGRGKRSRKRILQQQPSQDSESDFENPPKTKSSKKSLPKLPTPPRLNSKSSSRSSDTGSIAGPSRTASSLQKSNPQKSNSPAVAGSSRTRASRTDKVASPVKKNNLKTSQNSNSVKANIFVHKSIKDVNKSKVKQPEKKKENPVKSPFVNESGSSDSESSSKGTKLPHSPLSIVHDDIEKNPEFNEIGHDVINNDDSIISDDVIEAVDKNDGNDSGHDEDDGNGDSNYNGFHPHGTGQTNDSVNGSPTMTCCCKKLERIDSKLDMLAINLEVLARHIVPGQKLIKRPEGMPGFPVESMKDLGALENFLKSTENMTATAQYLTKFLKRDSMEKSTRILMAKIIGKETARNFTFTGATTKSDVEKYSFSSLKTWDLITSALVSVFANCDVRKAGKEAGRWLTESSYTRAEK